MPSTSRIGEVTVYRQGARVTRVVPIDPGAGELRVGPLPLCLEDGSVRVRVEGDGVRALDVRVALATAPPDASLPPADDEALRAARLRAGTLRSELERLTRAQERLQKLEMLPRPKPRAGEAPLAVPVEARLALVTLRGAESERLQRERGRVQEELARAERELGEAEDRHRRASTERNAKEHALCKQAVVRLEGTAVAGSPARLLVEYVVPGARWSPAYALTLDDGGGPARLEMRALVAQRTGEDWRDARLVLSNADPDRFVALPELARLRIGRAQPPVARRGFRAPPEGAAALYADHDAAFGAPEEAPRTTPVAAVAGPPGMAQHGAAHDSFQTMDMSVGGGDEGAVLSALAEEEEPPPAPPPPPAPARARAMMSRAGSFGAGPPPALAPQAAAMPSRKRAEPVTLRPTAPDLDVEALAFARLRMLPADRIGRGELTVVAWWSAYVEDVGAAPEVDVVTAVRVASGRAEDLAVLPPGHVLAAAADGFFDAYAVELPCDVPSDGAFHAVPVTACEAAAALRHVTVPREDQAVYRVLEMENPLGGSLLPGPVDVYEQRAGQVGYLLTACIEALPPRAEVRLGLGVEQAIKVARNTTYTEQTKGLLGGGLALVHDVEVEIQNRLPRPVTVEVRERVPVRADAEDDAVEVELGTVAPAWEAWDQDQTLEGGRRWVVEVGARAARKLTARYTVRIASKHELQGGNRREP